MNVKDLLEELREGILHDRSDRFGGDTSDYLWSDKSLIRYINEAQRRFARESFVLRSLATVTLIANQTEYALPKQVFAVLSARVFGQQTDLPRAGHGILDTYRAPDTYFFDVNQLNTRAPGAPLAFATDEFIGNDANGSGAVVNARIFPAPDTVAAGRIVTFRVIHTPINDLTLDKLSASPEIPEDHHLEMLDWAAYLALRVVDTDAGSPARAQEFATSFGAHTMAAKKMVMRKMFSPQIWGFGRNGFSWESN